MIVSVLALYYCCKSRTEGPRAGPGYGSLTNDEGNTIINNTDNTGNGNRRPQVL